MSALFGSGETQTVDTGAKDAAQIQADVTRAQMAQDQTRWQKEQDDIAKQKADAIAQTAQDKADAEAKLASDQESQRLQNFNQSQALAKTGTPNAVSDIQKQNELLGYTSMADDAKNKYKNMLQQLPGAFGQSNSLLSRSGFNAGQTGGQRMYRS